MEVGKRTAVGLFILRVGLGIFLLLWSIDKLVVPAGTVRVFSNFYHLTISATVAPVVGVLELLLSILILGGLWKKWTYGLGMILHAISTISTYNQLLDPFGKNHLFIAAIPVLGAFIALFLMRDEDTLWVAGKKAAAG
jgi:putative oxidoreductase